MKNKASLYPSGFDAPELLSGCAAQTSILVAFSGGPDSRVLLDLLCRYSKDAGCRIYAAHLNHGIRGAEADRDERFCAEVAKKYGIEIFTRRADVPSLAKQSSKSIELAARDERYAFFAQIMRENSIPLLATAHNANDNLETVLFNLSRGSGISGLSGIPPVRKCEGGLLIRPILRMSREEILEYCEQNDLDYVIDSTNTETDYTRNKIRAEIIPVLKGINSAVEKKAATSSALLRRDEELLSSLADKFIAISRTAEGAIALKALNSEHVSVVSRAIIKLYDAKRGASLEQVHVEDVIALAKKAEPHSRLSLPAGGYALIENGALYFLGESELNERSRSESEDFFLPLEGDGVYISQINAETVIGKSQTKKNIYKKSIQFSIDSAKINGGLFLRPKMQGDRIFMGNMHKSVKKLMCDKKIPVEDRARLPMICDTDGIVAIPFIGVCDRADPKKTKNKDVENILDIQFYLY